MHPNNRYGYGLNITNGWNTYKDRQLALEAFRDSAIALGAKFVSGHELLTAIKGYQALDNVGTEYPVDPTGWTPTTPSIVLGTIANGSVPVVENSEEGFYSVVADSSFQSVDHMSLTYKTNVALKIQLEVTGGDVFEALLTNIGPTVNSGKIPVSAFKAGDANTAQTLVAKNVVAIHITPQWMGTNITAQFSVSNVSVWGTQALVIPTKQRTAAAGILAINRLTAGAIAFNAPVAGAYKVNVFGLNGQLVRSVSRDVKAGSASFSLGTKLAPAMYLVKIQGVGKELSTKLSVDGSM